MVLHWKCAPSDPMWHIFKVRVPPNGGSMGGGAPPMGPNVGLAFPIHLRAPPPTTGRPPLKMYDHSWGKFFQRERSILTKILHYWQNWFIVGVTDFNFNLVICRRKLKRSALWSPIHTLASRLFGQWMMSSQCTFARDFGPKIANIYTFSNVKFPRHF